MRDRRIVRCSCGAEWHGKYVDRGAVNIAAHRDRGHTLTGATMRNYHLILTGGDERNIKAADFHVDDNGNLAFNSQDGDPICVYARGAWQVVEVERLDDKG